MKVKGDGTKWRDGGEGEGGEGECDGDGNGDGDGDGAGGSTGEVCMCSSRCSLR